MMSSKYEKNGIKYNRGSVAAVWGNSTLDDTYLVQNLDWPLSLGAQTHPCIVLYIPTDALPHVNITFAGMVGSYAAMNLAGIAVGQVCTSPDNERPFNMNGTDSSAIMRSMMYSAQRLSSVPNGLNEVTRNKRYMYLATDSYWERNVSAYETALNQPIKQMNPYIYKIPYLGDFPYYVEEPIGDGKAFIEDNVGQFDAILACNLAAQMGLDGTNAMAVVFNSDKFECYVAYGGENTDAKAEGFIHVDFKNYLP